jgi:hypothetical protein
MKNPIYLITVLLFSFLSFYSCQDSELSEPYLISESKTISTTDTILALRDTLTNKDTLATKDTLTTNETPTVAEPPITIENPTPNQITSPYKISEPIVWNGVSNKTISYLEIKNPKGASIQLINCTNIKIEYCKLGPSKGEGVAIYNSTNISVTNCTMDSIATGVSAVESFSIKVDYNDVRNVVGPFPRGQMAQFDEVSGAGSSISYNVCENIAGKSRAEDAISLFKSHGTAAQPIKVVGNWIRGGGPSLSGGGIILGDYGGSYINVEDNILVDPGQYGIAITAGNNLTIKNNKIYGRQQSFTFWGLMSYIQYPDPTHSNTISNNEVNWKNHQGIARNFWDDGKGGLINGWSTNAVNLNLNTSILPTTIIGKALKKAIESKSN